MHYLPDLNWWIPYLIAQGIVIGAMTFPVWWFALVMYLKFKDNDD
jgi:hypothetical protein